MSFKAINGNQTAGASVLVLEKKADLQAVKLAKCPEFDDRATVILGRQYAVDGRLYECRYKNITVAQLKIMLSAKSVK